MPTQNKVQVVMTGGHAGGFAYAVVDALRAQKLNWDVHWIGPKYAVEGSKALTIEAKTMEQKGVAFHRIVAGKLQKKFTRFTIPALFRLPIGFAHAAVLLRRIRPQVVLSFGGYASFPVVVAAWIARIPVVVHEQITGLGLANRLAIPFATKVLLARKESAAFVPRSKAKVVGNPIRHSIFLAKPKISIGNPPTIFVFTGSRGSQIVNAALLQILPELLVDYKVLHLTGELDFKEFGQHRDRLPADLKKKYKIYNFIDPDEVYKLYDACDMVLSRAGANTLAELQIVKRPALVIPFPYIHFDEQTKNAKAAEKFGIAKVLPQAELTPARLLKEIRNLTEDWVKIVRATRHKVSQDSESAEKIVTILSELLS